MNNLKKFYQNNRIYCILMMISIFCILLIVGAFVFYFYEQIGKDSYGTRLYGIESIKISDSDEKNVVSKIKENKIVDSVTMNVKGKIVYFTVNITEGSLEDAEGIAIKMLDYLDADIKEYYDISFAFTNSGKDEKSKFFPMMGYKKSDATLISWTKVSEKTGEDNEKE